MTLAACEQVISATFQPHYQNLCVSPQQCVSQVTRKTSNLVLLPYPAALSASKFLDKLNDTGIIETIFQILYRRNFHSLSLNWLPKVT